MAANPALVHNSAIDLDRLEELTMGLRVNTNIASLTAQRALTVVTRRLGENFARLASGLRPPAQPWACRALASTVGTKLAVLSQAAVRGPCRSKH